jgi:hypothetical protein
MVNFRFHLISLVAIFLSLAIGVALGSGFVGEAITRNLEEDIAAVRTQNGIVRGENLELREQLEDSEDFALGVRSWMIDGALQGQDVVFIRFDHADTVLTDAAGAAVEEADGTVASTITITDKLALGNPEEVDELTALVGASDGPRAAVRDAMALRLGLFMSQAARQPPTEGIVGSRARLEDFLAALQDAGFVGVEEGDAEVAVPSEAMFVILGGGSGRPGFNAWRFGIGLASGLLDGRATVAVGERSESEWNLVQRVRDSDDVSGSVVTVDHAETTTGQIALVSGLARAGQGVTGHYGRDRGASGPLPEASLD